ncbi:MAG: hypothetical protein ACYCT7_09685 [bacterium]
MKRLIIVLLMAFVFMGSYFIENSTAMAYANFMKHKMNHNHNKFNFKKMDMLNLFMLKRKLHLTRVQFKQAHLIKKEEIKALRKNMMNFRNPMLNALKSGKFNKTVFISDITTNVKNIAEIKAGFISKFFKILTPQQMHIFTNMIKNKIKNKIKHLEIMKKMINNRLKMMKENLNN